MARLAESPPPYLKQEFGFEAQKPVQLQFRQNQVFALMRMGDPESGEVYRVIQQVCQENSLSVAKAEENVGSEETKIHFDIGLLRVHRYRSLDHLREMLSVGLRSMVTARKESHDTWLRWLLSILRPFKG